MSDMAAQPGKQGPSPAQEALQQSSELLRLMFDESPLGIAIVGLDFCLQRINKTFCRTMGYSADELTGRSILDVTLPEDAPASLELSVALRDGRMDHFQLDKRYLRKDGQIISARTTAWKVCDGQGRPLHFLAMVEDITQRRRIEEEAEGEGTGHVHHARFGLGAVRVPEPRPPDPVGQSSDGRGPEQGP